MNDTACIVLAAGDGKRMKSNKPKVLMNVLFTPMLGWVLDSAEKIKPDEICVVVGSGEELVKKYLASRSGKYTTVSQRERKGTGHAVMQAEETLKSCKDVLVLCGDAPFMDENTVSAALEAHRKGKCGATVIAASPDDPFGYGRIVRDEKGDLLKIVEQKDASPEEQKISEINSGAYWFDSRALLEALPKLSDKNAAGEFYLTDAVALIKAAGKRTAVYTAENKHIVLGANSRADLNALNSYARLEIINRLMEKGVEFPCTDGVIIGKDAEICMDTVILPNTIIRGKSRIGFNCEIGPNSVIEDTTVGDGVSLNNVQSYQSVIESGAKIGPFAQLRPGSHIGQHVKIGDFVEIKNSNIGEKTSVAHLTYLGDSDVGRGVNFGCGCVTANYDGINKFRTKIGDDAFIGCNTNLIAPVEIGANAATGAGSTITKNVPANSLAVERSDTKIVEQWEKNKLRPKK
ncbi:MAG: bifunctional UDP-N-acetylglucosamine diphosphorylase/glucosamine-1-phosphate N-acetyltransferase GlmU [[Eubacterium] siraeum]|nr:bifunctional UDP-N-acetylglucosamine diphosphorylase/glucosamine-1-phosphate N-acetyltransferase GlmU [[Eubacterium] siraeum]